ncbi:MAG: cbb3-type cytochrome c oxidase N-terminal domain-containing protein [Saprospiraceae bacterium]
MANKILESLTKATPVEKEKDVLLDHEYDGIKELDNVLPPWWLWLFYFSIAFGIIYLVKYHIASDWSSSKEYSEEVAIAKASVDKYMKDNGLDLNEANVTLATDAASIAEGKKIFNEPGKCATCHRPDGGGLIGPDLTDDKWIHGGDIKDLFNTINKGVPEKGMIAWGGTLSPQQIQDVASYILVELHGTNPPNPFAYPGDPK